MYIMTFPKKFIGRRDVNLLLLESFTPLGVKMKHFQKSANELYRVCLVSSLFLSCTSRTQPFIYDWSFESVHVFTYFSII